MNRLLAACLGLASAVSLGLASTPAAAQDTVIVGTSPAVEPTTTGPNRYLLNSGLFTLGASYVPALVVAIESDNEADDNLFIPVVGPWLNLSERECEGDCDNETLNKVLLVTDGVFQGLGALQIVSAFIFPETRTVTVSKSDGTPAVAFTVSPANFGPGANGLMAVGEF